MLLPNQNDSSTLKLFIKEKKMSKKLVFTLAAVMMLASLILSACGGVAAPVVVDPYGAGRQRNTEP